MTSAHSPKAKPWKTAAYLIKQQAADCSRQLCFCRRLRVPTPRHDSRAAIDPVETVTPPLIAPSNDFLSPENLSGASRANWLVLLVPFYANSDFAGDNHWEGTP
jgi:hypothetical protein